MFGVFADTCTVAEVNFRKFLLPQNEAGRRRRGGLWKEAGQPGARRRDDRGGEKGERAAEKTPRKAGH